MPAAAEQRLMATTPKLPKPYSWAVDRELIELAKTMDLDAIVKRTGRKPDSVFKMAKRLRLSLKSGDRPKAGPKG
jgi:hypothetical protein